MQIYCMAIFILTGTPGTGKSTLASYFKEKNISVLEINKIVNENNLWTRKEKGSKVVDLKKLKNRLEKEIKSFVKSNKSIIIEGHLACEIPLKADAVIVLRTNPKILLSRLKKRKYPEEKIAENIQTELLDYCTKLSEYNYSCPIYEVDTSKDIKNTIKQISNIFLFYNDKPKNSKLIKRLSKLKPRIDWSKYSSDKSISKYLYR